MAGRKVRCLRCLSEVESRYPGDRQTCRCRAVEVDGENVALRVGWEVRNTWDWWKEVRHG